uniref:60 kDa neurofilament protein n=1 Tax=Magallana gigas TaxID=29159 RepID=K1PWQ2_MAGGI|eukprot:XP_011443571.1 PREDICTED: 70 kDa neurofilament protein [Crassostrea gigas]
MSQTRETVTEKRTVIKSSSGSSGGFDNKPSMDHMDVNFRSSITPRRSNVIQRSSTGPGFRQSMGGSSSGGTSYVRTVEYGYGSKMDSGLGPGGYEKVSSTGVSTVKNSREREKKDMQELNERFANYIEKVRFLEAQNRKLASELETLRDKWGQETSAVKQMYESELAEARKLIDDLTREKTNLEIKNQSLQEQMQDMQRQLDDAKKYRNQDRDTIGRLNQQVSDLEAEVNLLRRTVESLETDRSRDRERIKNLEAEVDRLRLDLNNETLAHLDAENRRQTLEEEIEFLKKVHEQELKELAALAYRDTTEENREFWKSELSQAIRDIQKEYDNKVDQIRGDMEGFYNLKIQEFRTGATKQNMEVTHIKEENKKLMKQISDQKGRLADLEARNALLEKQYQDLLREYETIESEHTVETTRLKEEITSLRAEMEGILQELQTIMDHKLSLELEIAAYRKLLESEESRYVRGIVASVAALRHPSWRTQRMQPNNFTEPDEEPQDFPEPKPVPEPKMDMDDDRAERDITPDEDNKPLEEETPAVEIPLNEESEQPETTEEVVENTADDGNPEDDNAQKEEPVEGGDDADTAGENEVEQEGATEITETQKEESKEADIQSEDKDETKETDDKQKDTDEKKEADQKEDNVDDKNAGGNDEKETQEREVEDSGVANDKEGNDNQDDGEKGEEKPVEDSNEKDIQNDKTDTEEIDSKAGDEEAEDTQKESKDQSQDQDDEVKEDVNEEKTNDDADVKTDDKLDDKTDDKVEDKTDDEKKDSQDIEQEKETPTVNGDAKESGDDDEESHQTMKMMRGEVSAKTTFQRTANGPLTISEVCPEGKYISIENTTSGANRREVNMDGWKLKRTVDGKRDYIYMFRNFTLKPGKVVKIYSRGSAADASVNDLVYRDDDSWGVGSQVTTVLLNESSEEKATHTQKTLYN